MAIVTLRFGLRVMSDDNAVVMEKAPGPIRWVTAAGVGDGDHRVYSISATTFQALTVPTGARAVYIEPEEGATSLTLRGASGDGTGVAIRPTSDPIDGPFFTFLGTSPSIGIYNGGGSTQTVDVWFL